MQLCIHVVVPVCKMQLCMHMYIGQLCMHVCVCHTVSSMIENVNVKKICSFDELEKNQA